MGSHVAVGAPPVLVEFLVGIGMFTEGTIWLLTHGQMAMNLIGGRWISCRWGFVPANYFGGGSLLKFRARSWCEVSHVRASTYKANELAVDHLVAYAKPSWHLNCKSSQQTPKRILRVSVSGPEYFLPSLVLGLHFALRQFFETFKQQTKLALINYSDMQCALR